MLLGVLEFVPDQEQALAAVGALVDALPSGSYLTITQGIHTEAMDAAAAAWNASGATPITLRHPEEILRFFDGLEILEPGLVPLPQWRPDPDTRFTDHDIPQYGAVARKP
nr:hypothetical protein GCM10020093_068090 [Planobispora longispora]